MTNCHCFLDCSLPMNDIDLCVCCRRTMDFAGRDGRPWTAAILLLSFLAAVQCVPIESPDECFEHCKDIDNEGEKEKCVLNICPDLDRKGVVGAFVNTGEEDEMEPFEDKRASHFVRIGKYSPNSFVRIGKANPGSFVRIGRANRNSFVRIGKSLPRYFLRMIKGNPSSFVRIGRANPGSFVRIGKAGQSSFVRIGKSLEDGDTPASEEDKRTGAFVRIGKANPGSLVRIGKGNPGSFVRIGKSNPSSFVRIGKSAEEDESSPLTEQNPAAPVHTRQDPSTFLRLG